MTNPRRRHAVVDASAIVDLLLQTPHGAALNLALRDPLVDAHAPSVCDLEVTAAMRRALLQGALESEEEAQALLCDLVALPIRRYEHGWLLRRVLELRQLLLIKQQDQGHLPQLLVLALARLLVREMHHQEGQRVSPDQDLQPVVLRQPMQENPDLALLLPSWEQPSVLVAQVAIR